MRRLWLIALLGCTGRVDLAESGAETGSTPPDSGQPADTGICAGAPVLSWENFGHSFFTENCQSCHASTAPERHGAPKEVQFDTEAQVWELADRVLERATGSEPTMPPAGGVSADDRHLLELWLSCEEPPA